MSHRFRWGVRGAAVAVWVGAWWAVVPAVVRGQDTIPRRPRPDTAVVDSLARELDRLLSDTGRVPLPDFPRPVPASQQRVYQGLNPDISAIGDLLSDLSPGEPRWIGGEERFQMRETELGIQAVVDPFFRVDFFMAVHPDGVELEEGYLTAVALPAGMQARVGRFHLPFGKVNLTHRPELLTVDYPLVIREFFGPEGFAANGLAWSKLITALGFFQELQLYVLSGFEAGEHAGGAEHPEEGGGQGALAGRRGLLEELALLGHLRNYWDLTRAAGLEVGLSGAAGSVEHAEPAACPGCAPGEPVPEVVSLERRGYYGLDVTVRWRPPERAIYRSLVWNTELGAERGEGWTRWGGFTQVQWQVGRRWYVAGRFDAVEAGAGEERWLRGGSGYLTFFPSEFSRFRLGVERLVGAGPGEWRAVVQTTFVLGPHRPHPF